MFCLFSLCAFSLFSVRFVFYHLDFALSTFSLQEFHFRLCFYLSLLIRIDSYLFFMYYYLISKKNMRRFLVIMFAIERIKIIKDYLNKDKHVSVAKLSSLLNVTEVTIRRDLEKLEGEGFLKRAHGGAVLPAPGPPL